MRKPWKRIVSRLPIARAHPLIESLEASNESMDGTKGSREAAATVGTRPDRQILCAKSARDLGPESELGLAHPTRRLKVEFRCAPSLREANGPAEFGCHDSQKHGCVSPGSQCELLDGSYAMEAEIPPTSFQNSCLRLLLEYSLPWVAAVSKERGDWVGRLSG